MQVAVMFLSFLLLPISCDTPSINALLKSLGHLLSLLMCSICMITEVIGEQINGMDR